MDKENEFRIFLENEPNIKSEKAVNSRIAKLKDAEIILCSNADTIVSSDDLMYQSLQKLREYEDNAHSVRQNVLRKYYKFKNRKNFPKLNEYTR